MPFTQKINSVLTRELNMTLLVDSDKLSLVQEIMNAVKLDSPVFQLVKSRITQAWTALFKKGVITPQDVEGLKFGKVVVENILETCIKARRIFDINTDVHIDLYNRLIGEAVSRL